jgi:hypothetical protein
MSKHDEPRSTDTYEIRQLLDVARQVGPEHREYPGLVRAAEILRSLSNDLEIS